jgi:hypothetical protein
VDAATRLVNKITQIRPEFYPHRPKRLKLYVELTRCRDGKQELRVEILRREGAGAPVAYSGTIEIDGDDCWGPTGLADAVGHVDENAVFDGPGLFSIAIRTEEGATLLARPLLLLPAPAEIPAR